MNELIGIELTPDGKRIIVQTDNSFREKDLIKLVPGTVFRKNDDAWSCPLSWPACHAFRGVFGDRLILGPVITAWAQYELESWITTARLMRASEDWVGNEAEFPHQRVGTAWLQVVRYGLIADEMRTGKTVQAAVALEQLSQADKVLKAGDPDGPFVVPALIGPVLIICPNGVRRVWQRHIEQWAPSLHSEVVGKTAMQRRKTFDRLDAGEIDTIIINWEALRLHSRLAGFGSIRLSEKDLEQGELNRHWSVVVADEVHRAKDPTSKQTRALWASSEDADYRWGFSGTPIANSPDDLWAIWHFLYPEEMPGKTRYVDRYCITSWNPFGGRNVTGLNPATEAELRKSLDVRMLRRTQSEVWAETPDVTYDVRYVELAAKERKAYESMLEDLVAELETGGEVVAWNPVTKTTRLLQLASASLECVPEGAKCSRCDGTGMDPEDQDHSAPCFRCQGTGLVDRFDVCEPSSKLDEFQELLVDLGWIFGKANAYVAPGEPIIVVAKSRQLLQLLEKRLDKQKLPFGAIHGQVPEASRNAAIDRFQGGEINMILLQAAAGGEGIDLSRANTMVFLQRPDSKIHNDQVEARKDGYFKGGIKQTIIDLVTEDSWEFEVFDTLIVKGERLEELFRDRDRLKERLKAGLKAPAKRKKAVE